MPGESTPNYAGERKMYGRTFYVYNIVVLANSSPNLYGLEQRSAEVARLQTLVSDESIPPRRLAFEGMTAYWNAFLFEEPRFIEPAQDILEQATRGGATALNDQNAYY